MTSWSWMVWPNRSMHGVTVLQGPRVNLTIPLGCTQPTASCPLAGVVGCVLPTCAQGFSRAKFPLVWEKGKINGSSSWGLVLLLLILVSVILGQHLDSHIGEGHRHSGQMSIPLWWRTSPLGVVSAWVGGRRWRLSRRRQSSKGVFFYFTF